MKNTDSESLTGNDSLEIITQMINAAKGEIRGTSFFFLLWGWVVLAANLGHYLLQEVYNYPTPYIVWLLCIPAGITSGIYGYFQRKKEVNPSHFNRIYEYIWMSFIISLVILLVNFAGTETQYLLNPLILMFVAFATFNSGIILKFKPLIYGGILFWIFAVIELYFKNENQFLISAFAVFVGYLVPGYLLKRNKR